MSTREVREQEEREGIAARMAELRAESLRMITTPDRWPAWPLLPLKRSRQTGMPDSACLTEAEVYGHMQFNLYEGANMYTFPASLETGKPVEPALVTPQEVIKRGRLVD